MRRREKSTLIIVGLIVKIWNQNVEKENRSTVQLKLNKNNMIKTIKQLDEINKVVGGLYTKDKTLENSKFGYAVKRFFKNNYNPALEEFKEKLLDIHVDNAMEDKNTKELLRYPADQRGRGFKYTKEGLKKCIEQERIAVKNFEQKEIEIEPYISSFIPEGLTDEQKEILKGSLI